MTTSSKGLIDDLVVKFPNLHPLLLEHLAYFGELLPHVFFGDVTEWAANLPAESGEWSALASALDRYYLEGDENARNLIAVSFIEGLPYKSQLLYNLGPALRDIPMSQFQRGEVLPSTHDRPPHCS